ncbi:hypothetical protein Tco_0369751 [Tanacetum coccineum]
MVILSNIFFTYAFKSLPFYGDLQAKIISIFTPFHKVSESSLDGLDSLLENGQWFIRNNPLILKKWNLDVNLMKKDVVNVPVWVKLHGVPITAFTKDGLSSIATDIGTPLMLDSYTSDMCIQSWGRSSYARALIEIRADVELKDTIVVVMPKLTGEGFYTCIVRVEYESKPPRCACCKVFGHIHEEFPKNPGVGVAKNLKKPSQTSRGVPVGPKVGFKPAKEYRLVAKNPSANTSGNKKKEKIRKLGQQIIDEIWTLVVDDGKPLKRVEYTGDHDSDDEVYSLDNDMARDMATETVGFGTQSFLEKWKDSYGNGDYDEDPYDDDMYEGQDIPDKLQDIWPKGDEGCWSSRAASYGRMERGFLSQKGSGRGRGIKEKDLNGNKKNTSLGIGVSTDFKDTMNDDSPTGVASAVRKGVTPSVVDMTVEMGKQNSLDDTTVPESFPPLSRRRFSTTLVIQPAGRVMPYGFFLGKKVAYPVVANYVRNTCGKYGLVHSMFSSSTGLFSFQFSSMDGLDAMLENGPWFIQNNLLILKKWHPDENLLKEDVSIVPVCVKLHGVPITAFSEDDLSAIATKLADVELKDNIVVAMPKITREGHYTCNVLVLNLKKEYQPVTKKPTASSSGNKKKGVEPTIEVSNSNPFDVLNSVDNDGEFGTNEGTNNLVNNESTSNGSSFINIDNNGECATKTPIGAKIDKIERLIGDGKLRLLDNDGNPLVPTCIVESDSEVELVFPETTNLRIPTSGKNGSDKGYGTNSLLEQWRDSYLDNDDCDPYDNDMYENHDLSEHLQSICDDLDITVRGRKKK